MKTPRYTVVTNEPCKLREGNLVMFGKNYGCGYPQNRQFHLWKSTPNILTKYKTAYIRGYSMCRHVGDNPRSRGVDWRVNSGVPTRGGASTRRPAARRYPGRHQGVEAAATRRCAGGAPPLV